MMCGTLEDVDATVGLRLAAIKRRIAAAGQGRNVEIVAVTKGFGLAEITEAASLGLVHLGENYAQELVLKADSHKLPDGVRWHYLGRPQRNKFRRLAPHVFCWQGMGRLEEGEALVSVAPRSRVLVQVDFTGTRQGCTFENAPALVENYLRLGLDVLGLMTVAPKGEPEFTNESFARLAKLQSELGLAELSMGMSEDFEAAVEHGATMVRLGRALFGERPTAHA